MHASEAPGGSAARVTVISVFLALMLLSTPANAGNALRWERWGENTAIGGASEGAHAWISHGLYGSGRELGLERAESAGLAFAVMTVWEVCEVTLMDAKGVSVQDLAANAAGIAAGLVGLDLRYSYATQSSPESTEDSPWLGIPILPRNNMTYALELEHDGWTLGCKYLEAGGDVVVGTTSMPVLAGESGDEQLVPYVGREWQNGLHCALAYDCRGQASAGAGYRLSLWGLGLDANALVDRDGVGLGVSCFVDYGPYLGR